MKSKLITTTFILIGFFFISQSCKKEKNTTSENQTESNNKTNVSSFGSVKSHNMGQNCMNCHKSGGTGEGWFNVAGTVYDSLKTNTYPNATVRLYTGPNATGILKYTGQVDAKGNFHTTEIVDFTGGLYPSIQGSLSIQHMSSSITTGQCNSCHGVSTSKLWVK